MSKELGTYVSDRERKINIAIGRKFQSFRLSAGKTQTDVGNFFGCSFQQIQKYENGSNRISAAKLFDFLISHEGSMQDFFSNFDTRARPSTRPSRGDLALIQDIMAIKSATLKQQLRDMVKIMRGKK